MEKKGSSLADRFKAAIDASRAAQDRDAEERERLAAEARAAREVLLDDLAAFADAVGHIAAQRDEQGLTMRYGDRSLRFERLGEHDRVRVIYAGGGDEQFLYRVPELADRWVRVFRRRHREERLPLFDSGLEELLVDALGLPRPGGATTPTERPMAPRTAAALVGEPAPVAPAAASRPEPPAPPPEPTPAERKKRL